MPPPPPPVLRLVRRKAGVLCPGFVGMRGLLSDDYGMDDREYPPAVLCKAWLGNFCFETIF